MTAPYRMPLEQVEDEEFLSFARKFAVAILVGLVIAAVVYPW